MDIPMSKIGEGSENLTDYSPEHSESKGFDSTSPIPNEPMTVQELGNMYAEWRTANEFSSGTEKWMPNHTILLIPAPKRKFNWKVCWSFLVVFAVLSIAAFGFAYYIDNYTSYKITNGKSMKFEHGSANDVLDSKLKQFETEVDEQLRNPDQMLNDVEEFLRSREETMKEMQRIQEQHDDIRSSFLSVLEFERQRKILEDQRSRGQNQDMKNQLREILSHLSPRLSRPNVE